MVFGILELSIGMVIGIIVGMWVMYAGHIVKKEYLTKLFKKMLKEQKEELQEVKQ